MGEGRIVDWANWGEHIPLTCKNHPEKRWSTKNIGCIGMRTVFYNLHKSSTMGPECDCPAGSLRPLTEEEFLSDLDNDII